MQQAEIVLEFKTGREAELVYNALMPEVKARPAGGVYVDARLSGNKIFIYIKAENISKLRAAINSYGRLVALAYDVLSFMGGGESGSKTPARGRDAGPSA